MSHPHDPDTTPSGCVEFALRELDDLAGGDIDAAPALDHGLEALHILVRMVDEARDVAAELYLSHHNQGTLEDALAELTTRPAWLTDELQEEQLPLA